MEGRLETAALQLKREGFFRWNEVLINILVLIQTQ